ncbi:DNA-binding protein [Cronobacter sakazakii]|uniref:helix-turn-helix transcriptional regulator n=1 Tax=Cronobacter sakazakii TaxID=28141 RepID=UPI000CF067DD|nr:AlpA family transcriptional regulator [Cronobacter sakazakii]EJE1164914.1 AlpA family transcriptional regulator [Cronobacter sakazakii]ELY4393606.1 AlpA family transcriptional regulator [Cronobacter sakazakii]ELY4868481.1 AlpA family transcriptional regulator [Cronobacter sakazakii]MDI7561266.1 AlpA family transcriptional regulator [Cronobacter sakazakii]MDI7564113.1 AlpA family transcriptional regulator [Cronobacter sakazakii]
MEENIQLNNRLLRITDVINLTGLPKSTIYLKVKNNQFPSQVKIGTRSVAWVENEIQEWIKNNIQRRL